MVAAVTVGGGERGGCRGGAGDRREVLATARRNMVFLGMCVCGGGGGGSRNKGARRRPGGRGEVVNGTEKLGREQRGH